MDNLIYLGYARKSSEDETRQAQSIGTQVSILTEYVKTHSLNLLTILKEARSAKSDGNRPQFDLLISKLIAGEANAIFVAHVDRLARNGTEAVYLIKLFEQGIVKEIKTPMKSYNTLNDIMSLEFEFVFAAEYSRRLSARVKEGNQAKLNRGEYPNQAPIGYFNKEGKIYPHKQMATLVSKLFTEFATGEYSISTITRFIQSQGLLSKSGKVVSHSVVHRILTDSVYYGVIKNKGKLYAGIHKSLITKAVFDKTQALLEGKKTKGDNKLSFLYRSYLTCDVCGCKLTATKKKGRYVYYYCTNGKGMCKQHKKYLPESRVQKLVGSTLTSFSLPGHIAKESLQLHIEDLQRHTASHNTARTHLTKAYAALDSKLDRLEDMRLDGEISKSRYDQKKKKIENELAKVKAQLNNVPKQDFETTVELLQNFKDQAVNIDKLFENGNDTVKSHLLKSALWNCQIRDGKIVSTRYKKPYSFFENMQDCKDMTTWRRRWDSNPRNG